MKKLILKIKTAFFSLKFKNQLLCMYLLLSMIPIITLGCFSYAQSKSLMTDSKAHDMEFYFDKSTDTLNNIIEKLEEISNSIADSSEFQEVAYNLNISEEARRELLISLLEPNIYNLKQLNPTIREITYYSKLKIPSYRSIIQSYSRFSQPENYIPSATPKWCHNDNQIMLIRDIYNSSGSSVGTLVIYMYPRALMGTVSTEFMNYNIMLTDEEKKAIFTHKIFQNDTLPDFSQLKNLDSKTLVIDKKKYNVISDSIKNDWFLYAYIPSETITAGAKEILRSTLIVTILCLICIFIVSYAFSLFFTKRINTLNEKISRVKTGDFSNIEYSEYHDEIGSLSNEVSDMIVKVDDLIETVYKSEIRKRKAEFKALQSQIKPHFLYNTLQAINWIAIDNELPEISEITVNLSNFYRITLNQNEDDIPISAELQMVKYYLDIEHAVIKDTFDFEFNIDKNVYNFKTIHLILQPIVENAIEHGIRNLKDRKGLITISAFCIKDSIVFEISDNGLGLATENDDILYTSSKGYGLKNINERIQLRFGQKYGLCISSFKNPTTFRVVIPKLPL